MNITDVDTEEELEGYHDRLVEIFKRQTRLEEKYKDIEIKNGALVLPLPLDVHTFQGQVRIKDLIFRIADELFESSNCLRNKAWKTTHVATDEAHFREELIDGFHFYVQLFIELGMSAEDVYQLYCKKNKVNQFRQGSNY